MQYSELEWLKIFAKKKGRPLKVLHIGNIANNAYINAKIMRSQGITADVICHNYYHIMSCPEWEDLTHTTHLPDANHPNWRKANLKKYKRPSWFIQGPTKFCLLYLTALNEKKLLKTYLFKKICTYYRYLYCGSAFDKKILALMIKIHNLTLRLFYKHFFIFQPNFCRKVFNILFSKRVKQNILPQENDISDNIFQKLCSSFLQFFPERKNTLTMNELETYSGYLSYWINLLKHYDIVQGYALDGIYPLLAQHPGFTAYEHGTIRQIPFENNTMGKICALVYKSAASVFITNTDCIEAGKRLNIDAEKMHPLPHAFDSEKAFSFYIKKRHQIQTEVNPPVFFAPARHHWKHGDTSWVKGNDKIIHAIKELSNKKYHFKVIFIHWGVEVPLSKELITELNIDEYCDWIEPLNKKSLWEYYLKSVAVIDQFIVPAFGGITFEALSMGRPVITRIDEPTLNSFFGEAPPLYNAATVEEISQAMEKIILDPLDKVMKIGNKAQDWIKKYHSAEVVLRNQLKAYRKLITNF